MDLEKISKEDIEKLVLTKELYSQELQRLRENMDNTQEVLNEYFELQYDKIQEVLFKGFKLAQNTKTLKVPNRSELDQELETTPEFIADFIKARQKENWWLGAIFIDKDLPQEVRDWLGFTPAIDMYQRIEHQNLFAKTWCYGVEEK